VKRTILTYGVVSGVIVIGGMIGNIILGMDSSSTTSLEYIGYLIMLIALSAIFVAIRKYRDDELGGVIGFGTATLLGLGIALVASVTYVVTWEIYLAATDHAFIHDYVAAEIDTARGSGMSGAELETYIERMEAMRTSYGNPMFRLPMTFLEIFPVGMLITLISAGLLRRSEVLPA